MRRDLVEAERAHAARAAYLAVRRAGLLREGNEAARADALFPEPAPRAGVAGRLLAVLFVSFAIVALTFFLAESLHVRSVAGIGLTAGILLVLATELVQAAPRVAWSGAAGTTACWAWSFLVVGAAGLFEHENGALPVVLPLAALLGAIAAWRWGVPLLALAGGGALLAWLARAPHGRLLWVVAALVAAPLLERAIDRPRAPSHRESLAAALAVALGGLYAALNVWSVTAGWVEEIGGRGTGGAPAPAAWIASAWWGTLLVPLAVLAWGFATRRLWLLSLGGLFAALSAVTVRRYIHLAPLWELLVAAGAVLALLALGAMRLLAKRGEVGGFTDEALLSSPGRAEALGTVALVASQLPATHEAAHDDGARFAAGGGSSGGGGASDSY